MSADLTKPQTTALAALFNAKARGARFVEVRDLNGVSSIALRNLADKGLVKTSDALARRWDCDAYTLTVSGLIAARRIVEG